MDKSRFFHEATLRICGNLEIEEALQKLLRFLKDVMPAARLLLQRYDHGFNGMRLIAYASQSSCGKMDFLTPLPKDAQIIAGNVPVEKDIFLVDDPQAFPVAQELLKFHNFEASSLIDMILRSKGEILGSLILISKGEEKFTEEHLKWVMLLREPLIIAIANALKHQEILKLKDLLADDNRYLHSELRRLSGDEIVGANFGLKAIMHQVQQVAGLDSPVLLLGETGVGKDVIANTIHYSSPRSKGPFVSVNCGAIPETLIDSELFGHEKGAFTGALSQKRGRFERADKGTIFLDEIGELPLQAQVRLLRVVQSKEIERVGGVESIPLDIRIIAATNRNLEEMIRNHQFREDLWFRLNVFPITLPPLRQRNADIPSLLQHFIKLKSKHLKLPQIPTLSDGAIAPLMEYHWPGNVRELENVVERALILNPTGPLSFENLNLNQVRKTSSAQDAAKATGDLDTVISRHIQNVLTNTEGRINGPGGAAEILGVNPSTLRHRMKKLGIK